MALYGKYSSLTLVNWNGFFARTFELDELVTTLSGGNGAGKSTTMAAFVTALIPDLTLLHFRNTTEAGSTSSSRDKGLYGKLRPGVCYAMLDVLNSVNQRILCGVRLQQVAGRDKKVDIKPFVIQGLPTHCTPTEVVTERVSGRQVRILSLSEVKDHVATVSGVHFKQFNAITDYHATMFDAGVLPKRLRSAADRSKYYRLIEASLYGGISSAITRSLREYLLPENSGVRKAFQDMEAALRENRLTLEAIRITQSDRDLFKHLVTATTDYVASDYMRLVNERRLQIGTALTLRQDVCKTQFQMSEVQRHQTELQSTLQDETKTQKNLENAYRGACEQLNSVQTAMRQQEKIDRYQNDVDEMQFCLEEHTALVIESNEKIQAQQVMIDEAEREVDDIKNQLADHQHALDRQQTRTIQYQQALDALEKAKTLCEISELTCANVDGYVAIYTTKEKEITTQLLELENSVNSASLAEKQFDHAYTLVKKLQPGVTPETAWETANTIMAQWSTHKHQADYLTTLKLRLSESTQQWTNKQKAEELFSEICQQLGYSVTIDELSAIKQTLQSHVDDCLACENEVKEEQAVLKQAMFQIQHQVECLTEKAPTWLKAQDKLANLRAQSNAELTSSQQIMAYLQQLLAKESELRGEKDHLMNRLNQIDQQIARLTQPNGGDDSRLMALAEQFNGVLLTELYEDISFEDAAYFSALYGPLREAIVVPDLHAVSEVIDNTSDYPDEVYFIEGDPASFDDKVFECEERQQAVLVKESERRWRLSRFPNVPVFGRSARNAQLDALNTERDTLNEHYTKLSFDLEKSQRLQYHFNQFIGEYISTAFDADPEAAIVGLNAKRMDMERQCMSIENRFQTAKHQVTPLKKQLSRINELEPYHYLLADEGLRDQLKELQNQIEQANASFNYVKQHKTVITELEPLLFSLKVVPIQNSDRLQQYEQIKQDQRHVRQQLFALNEVWARRTHFSYKDASHLVDDNTDLSGQLRKRLAIMEKDRQAAREKMRQYQQDYNQLSQTLASLKSAFETKHDMLRDLNDEMQQLGISIDGESEKKATLQRDEYLSKLTASQLNCKDLDKALLRHENELEQTVKKIKRLARDYQLLRQQVVNSKITWCGVMRLVKVNDIEKRLHRRDYAYLNGSELRSISDKALGSLRQAVANNEPLRDLLRASEDTKNIGGKVHFYLAVYAHLRERIRQDIIKTDDPIDAIEQMEIELSRLTDELTTREHKLSISSKSVANIIRKTIQREQNRIYMLNQGLQSIIFGQVNGVRLNVTLRESHATLLMMLSEHADNHQDLFGNHRITFSEALAKLYQRLNPQVEIGQRSAQTLGEELLDYRNYLELDVEVNRNAEGWLRAESGALSTGEAIGTGMSILLMVMQSWEEESKRLRGKDKLPCRLLFLDEAARLDAKSISTLFELCERLTMQLIIAAPENISPEKGTTYKLVRKIIDQQEYVHVVGLKGFA